MIAKIFEWLGTQTINFIVNGQIQVTFTWWF